MSYVSICSKPNTADLLTGSWPTNISLSLTRMCTANAVHGSYCYPLYRSETIAHNFLSRVELDHRLEVEWHASLVELWSSLDGCCKL